MKPLINVYSIFNDYSIINDLSIKYNFSYNIVKNPYEQKTDLCFFSMENTMEDYKKFKSIIYKLKGNPKLIINSYESASNGYHNIPNKINTLSFYQQTNYTLSHNINSNQNCYQPYILTQDWDNCKENQRNNKIKNKTNFCNIITSNESIQRKYYINYISNNYKKVDSFGKAYHNTQQNYYEGLELDNIIPSYKFSLVIENELSFDNEIYLTEKIMKAFNWGTIPIYWGAINANKIFNEKAFINITGMSDKEIINTIKKYDENDDLYNEMLNQPIFNIEKEVLLENRDKFIKHIIFDDKETQLIHKTYNIGILGIEKSFFSKILENNHYQFNLIENINEFKKCNLIICNNLKICNKLVNDYKLKVLFICYNNDYDCGCNNIKQNLFTISEQDYNMHNIYIPHDFFIMKDINEFNLYCHNNELMEPLKCYNDFNYYEYYREIIIYFIIDIIENNMSRKIF